MTDEKYLQLIETHLEIIKTQQQTISNLADIIEGLNKVLMLSVAKRECVSKIVAIDNQPAGLTPAPRKQYTTGTIELKSGTIRSGLRE